MEFIKMHGLGNDYVFVDCLEQKLEKPELVAQKISRRHFDVGADGLILILPSETADFKMKMYNADGSCGSMCGNGIRCLGKYVYEHGKTDKKVLNVETDAGIRRLCLLIKNGEVSAVRVDMGLPDFDPAGIPALADGHQIVREELSVEDMHFHITCLSMGNPHCVIFQNHVDDFAVDRYGPLLERHELFPDRINVEFTEVLNMNTIKMRVWERGSGETYACGTGACAAAVAACVNGLCSRRVTVRLAGGDLVIHWNETNHHVYMTGSAEEVCTGTWRL